MDDVVSNVSHVQKVKDEHEKGLVSCLQKIRQWKKYKDDYQALHDRLTTLPDKLSYDIMVPFGSHAFMPGTIVHTNKITVLLGDNWFAEVSAKQACGIAERRIKQCEKMLEDLEKEKKQFENWLGYISEITNQEFVEIKEEYDPEKEKLWREQHAKNVQEYKKKAAEEKDQGKCEKEEVEENYTCEVQTLENYFSRFDSDDDNDISFSEEEEEASMENENTKSISSCDTEQQKDTHDKMLENAGTTTLDNAVEEENQNTAENTTVMRNDSDRFFDNDQKRHVRWIDLSEAKSRRITFTHSTLKSNNPKKKQRRRRKSSSTSEVEEEEVDSNASIPINSPSDIYKRFSFSLLSSKPKSILKSVPSNSVPVDSITDPVPAKPKVIRADRKKRNAAVVSVRTEHAHVDVTKSLSTECSREERKNSMKRIVDTTSKDSASPEVDCSSDVKEQVSREKTSANEERTFPCKYEESNVVHEVACVPEECDGEFDLGRTAPVLHISRDSEIIPLREIESVVLDKSRNEVEDEKISYSNKLKEDLTKGFQDSVCVNLKETDKVSDENATPNSDYEEKAFTGEVCEHQTTKPFETQAKHRPKSLFKSTRNKLTH